MRKLTRSCNSSTPLSHASPRNRPTKTRHINYFPRFIRFPKTLSTSSVLSHRPSVTLPLLSCSTSTTYKKMPPHFPRRALKPYLSEFLGTALLIILGDGVVAQCLLSDYTYGTWLSINISWASAVCLSAYLSDPSPAINPAVTLAIALVRPEPGQWKRIPGKLFAQFLGGFVGAAVVYLNYRSAIKAWDPELTIPGGSILSPNGHHSAGIFSTYPSSFFGSNWEAAFSELLGSAVLMFGVLSISDPANSHRFPAPQISMFILLLAIGASLGWQTGYVSEILLNVRLSRYTS